MSQAQTEIEAFLESEREWRAACLEAARAGGGAVEEARRLGRNRAFSTAEHELHAETERLKDDRDCWRECVVIVSIDRRTRQLLSKEPISLAESQRRWPEPPPPQPVKLTLEERISRLEEIARRNGSLSSPPERIR